MKVETNASWSECFDEEKIVCPFCGNGFDDSDHDYIYIEGEEVCEECPSCGRAFNVIAEQKVTYTTMPLNTTNDTWKLGDAFEDGCETQEEEDYCNSRVYCEGEKDN
jgi:hypothetical protein